MLGCIVSNYGTQATMHTVRYTAVSLVDVHRLIGA